MMGLSLSGGGARGAYQVGVLKGLGEILKTHANIQTPFSAYAGLSAGAINAVGCAAGAHDFPRTTEALAEMWGALETSDIYRSDAPSLARMGLGWIRSTTLGGIVNTKKTPRLLDASPLGRFLSERIDYSQIQKNIDSGVLRGVSCTAYNYNEQRSVTFVQGNDEVEHWQRTYRYSTAVEMETCHLMASSAIPFLFAPVKVNSSFYGDGTLRNTAPLSPIIHLGCPNFIFVGVRHGAPPLPLGNSVKQPSLGKVLGTILNGAFFDSLQIDFARVEQINALIRQGLSSEVDHSRPKLVNAFSITPSVDLSSIASQCADVGLPRLVRYLIQSMGDINESAELTSYLLFDSVYTKKLVEIGYNDIFEQKNNLLEFWDSCAG